MLNIILTSYNRPVLVQRTIKSVLAQTSDQWHLYIQDDGSGKETREILSEYDGHEQITVKSRRVSKAERKNPARYSALINELLPTFESGVIGYLCDNAEYHPETVATVLAFFADNRAAIFAGYTDHLRDTWRRNGLDGTERIGAASDYGHWNRLPPRSGPQDYPQGVLDHSQVFHRAPCDIEWPEIDPADGYFFDALVARHGSIVPIAPGRVLTYEHLLK